MAECLSPGGFTDLYLEVSFGFLCLGPPCALDSSGAATGGTGAGGACSKGASVGGTGAGGTGSGGAGYGGAVARGAGVGGAGSWGAGGGGDGIRGAGCGGAGDGDATTPAPTGPHYLTRFQHQRLQEQQQLQQ
ncbi:unnamed protein product [Closterium sp. NIES-54]